MPNNKNIKNKVNSLLLISYNINNHKKALIMSEGIKNNNSCGSSRCNNSNTNNIKNLKINKNKNKIKCINYNSTNSTINSKINYKNLNTKCCRSLLSTNLSETSSSSTSSSLLSATSLSPPPTTKLTSIPTNAINLPTIITAVTSTATTNKIVTQPTKKRRLRFNIGLSGLKTTSFLTILMLVCLETVLLSTVSNCAKTFYMHWNTSNSIFRIDNTDHIIDVNKGNLAFEFDQVHIICPVYEPGTFENETEKYIIYNVSKVEYETCRITNADPRVIAICDKPQKLMFFTITFRPFTPQPGGLEFLPGNDYYFISTSSKDDLYRRIGGRCSTNNMKVVFKVCCAPEDKNNRTHTGGMIGGGTNGNSGISIINNNNDNQHMNNNNQHHNNNININGQSTSSSPGGGGTSINTNIDQFNRIPMQQNGGGNNMGNNNGGQQQTGIRINNMPQNPSQNGMHGGGYMPPMTNINTNSSNVVQSTMSWSGWGNNAQGGGNNGGMIQQHSTPVTTIGIQPHFYPPHMTSPRPNINSAINNNSNYSPSHKPTKKTNEYDKHPNEVVKNEELTYNGGASSTKSVSIFNIMKRRTKLSSLFSNFNNILFKSNSNGNNKSNTNFINKLFLIILSNIYNPIIILTTILVILTNNLFQLRSVSCFSCRTSVSCQR